MTSSLITKKQMIPIEKQIWFVHLSYEPPLPLKVEILPNHSARVIGGKSGSHLSGHGESYWDKIVEVIQLGFVPVPVAKDLGSIPLDWAAPDEAQLDNQINGGVYSLKH
jgi:hypothetical protein